MKLMDRFVCAGYAEEATIRHGVLDEGVEFLQKPFTSEVLAGRVWSVLDKNKADAGSMNDRVVLE